MCEDLCDERQWQQQNEEEQRMSYVLTTTIYGEKHPIASFETLADALQFEDFAFNESSFNFEIEEVTDIKKNSTPKEIMSILDDKFMCWNKPTDPFIFEGYKRGE